MANFGDIVPAVLGESGVQIDQLRTAIVHDWFQGFHGAERVVDVMRRDLFAPGNAPDIYTFHAARELLPPELNAAIRRESRLASLPGIRQRGHDPGRWRYLLPLMPLYFARLPLQDYDLVITSSHAFAVHARPRKDAINLCYCLYPRSDTPGSGTSSAGESEGCRGSL